MSDRIALLLTLICIGLADQTLAAEATPIKTVVEQYCISCHQGDSAKAGVDLAAISSDEIGKHSEVWEKVVHRLRGRQMPPAGRKRPTEEIYLSTISQIESSL